jgi:hypothetical protein
MMDITRRRTESNVASCGLYTLECKDQNVKHSDENSAVRKVKAQIMQTIYTQMHADVKRRSRRLFHPSRNRHKLALTKQAATKATCSLGLGV